MTETATKEDLAEIRAGLWDGYGDLTRMVRRLAASIRVEQRADRAVEKLHRRGRIRLPGFTTTFGPGCICDGEPWPCQTITAIKQARMSNRLEEES